MHRVLSAFIKMYTVPLQPQPLFVFSLRSTKSEATFQTIPYKLHRLDSGPSTDVTITRNDALSYYRQLTVSRRIETAASNLYKEKLIRGFCHLYTGQEAVAVGTVAAKNNDDYIITSYRCHIWAYLTGSTIAQILSELMGRRTGNVYGKGGSMHMYNRNFFGGNGIVGAQTALGAGLAFALKYNKRNNVSYTFYGDGAANQGQLFEVINMCALWSLPCIFICENNGYGMGTAASRASAVTDYYTRGDFVPGIWADGMDVLAVRETIGWARKYCSLGKGPLMIEFATYRYHGHSMSDPGTSYRTREEVQQIRKTRDPITGFKNKITAAGLASEDELKQIDIEARKEVDEAVEIARNDPTLPNDALYSDLYHNTLPQYVRGVTVEKSMKQPYCTTADLLKNLKINA